MSLPGHQVSFHQCHQHISLHQASHWTWIELPTHPPHQALPLFGRRPAICRAKDRGKQNTAYQRWTKASLASSTPAGPICCASSPWWHLINYCPWCTGKQNQPESSWVPPKGGHDKKQNKTKNPETFCWSLLRNFGISTLGNEELRNKNACNASFLRQEILTRIPWEMTALD